MHHTDAIHFAEFTLEPGTGRLRHGPDIIDLRARSFQVLWHLAERPGQVVTKNELLDAIWSGVFVTESVLSVCVSELRKALGDSAAAPRFVETVHGKGYRFVGQVSGVGPPGPGTADRRPEPRLPSRGRDPLAAPFVGRSEPLRVLQTGLQLARAGHGRLILLTGVAGVGKTRLAEEIAAAAAADGFQVLVGRCLENEGAPPFWPWVQIVRAYARAVPARRLRSALGSTGPTIARIVPEVCVRIPRPQPSALLEPQEGRVRLFDALATLLKNAASAQPLVLVLDDLHWADKPSLLMLEFLAREMRDTRLLVLAAYRERDFDRGHPLPDVLGEVVRHPTVERITLEGLTEPDVAAWLAAVTDGEPSPDLVRRVSEKTDGNPFFVGEVVRLLPAGRREWSDVGSSEDLGIPRTVQEAIGRHLQRLSPTCNDALRVAAVIGRQFDVAPLIDVFDSAPRRPGRHQKGAATRGRAAFARARSHVEALLGEAVAARVLTRVAPGRYSFLHALIREVLYADVSTARRVELHRRTGQAIERLRAGGAEPQFAALSHHFSEAALAGHGLTDDAAAAIDYAVRAAEYAMQQLSYEEAARQYRLALTIVERVAPNGGQPLDQARRCELSLALATALDNAGDRRSAKPVFREVIRKARHIGRAEYLARAALGLAGWWALTYRDEGTLAGVLVEAERALGGVDSALHASVMARLAIELAWMQAPGYAELSEAAVAMARRVGDARAFGWAVYARHTVVSDCAQIRQLLALATEVVAMAETAADIDLGLVGRRCRIYDLLVLGDLKAVDVELATYTELTTQQRITFHMWSALAYQNLRALLDGRFGEVEQRAAHALAMGRGLQHMIAAASFGSQIHMLRRDRAAFDAATAASVQDFVDANPHHTSARCLLALMYLDVGDTGAAGREFEYFAVNNFADVFASIDWLLCTAYLAEACAELGDARRAAVLYEQLLPAAGYMVVANPSVLYGAIDYFLGRLAATMERWDDAIRHLDQALSLHRGMAARPLIACTQYAYAHTLCGRGDRADVESARLVLDEAAEIASHLGMRTLENASQTLKRELAAPLVPTGGDNVDQAAEFQQRVRAQYGLTPAESRLAFLLCNGDPLGSAASALDVSVHTARTQLRQIFAKTQTGRQVELVRLLLAVRPLCADAV